MTKSWILIVEDESIFALHLQNILKDNHYNVTGISSNAKTTVNLIEEQIPDLILMDINLKGDINGIQLTDIIKQNYDIPVIFLTAYDDDKTFTEMKQTEPYGFLYKPVEEKELLKSIELALFKHSTDKQIRQSEERFQQISQTAGAWVYEISKEGLFTYSNDVVKKILGYTPEEIVNKQYFFNFFPEKQKEKFKEEYREVFQREKKQDVVLKILHTDGNLRWLSTSSVPITDNQGEHSGFRGISIDISQTKNLEKQIMEAGAKEQRKLGQEIHDGLCQMLGGISFMCQSFRKKIHSGLEVQENEIEEIVRYLSQTLDFARNLSKGLYPVLAEREGLLTALEELAETIRNVYKIPCSIMCHEREIPYDIETSTHLFRIAQEAVNNAVKHAQASEIIIQLMKTANSLQLKIYDNGIGFTPVQKNRGGSGLYTMSNRAQMIDGLLTINKQDSGGTVVCCEIFSE